MHCKNSTSLTHHTTVEGLKFDINFARTSIVNVSAFLGGINLSKYTLSSCNNVVIMFESK